MNHFNLDRSQSALINEYKGNVFEYLVAFKLSLLSEVSDQFIRGVSPNIMNYYLEYEYFIKKYAPDLVDKLNRLSDIAAELLHKRYPSIHNVVLCGKLNANFTRAHFQNADLLLTTSDKEIPISLKYTDQSAPWINTKSGGVKTFLTKYFPCSYSSVRQKDLNFNLTTWYQGLIKELHEIYNISFCEKFTYWKQASMTVLPGELNDEAKSRFKIFYFELSQFLKDSFYVISQREPLVFKLGLKSLLGLSHPEQLTLLCNSLLMDVKLPFESFLDLKQIQFKENKNNNGNFEIELDNHILQIRPKMMNTFLTPGVKINCSVKFSR